MPVLKGFCTVKNIVARRFLLYMLAFSSLALTHLLFLKWAPAFHLDEAWAAIFSHRIATEPGFWPVQAMSPYTSAWSHYVTAVIFKLFGTNLWNFRVTGIAEVIGGIVLISIGLELLGESVAAWLFPLIVAFFPTLVMNHRWVIEQDTFFVLCAGIVFLGFALRWKRGWSPLSASLMVLGSAVAIGSHVLFLGPLLSVWIYLFLRGKLEEFRDRLTVTATAVLIFPFFLLILKTEADHTRPLALLLLDFALIAVSLFPRLGSWISERFKRRLLLLLVLCGVPLLVQFAIFGEGSWLELFFSGQLRTPFLIGTIFIPVALVLCWLPASERPGWRALRSLEPVSLIPLSLLVIQAMIVKPGPRYFELPYLFSALFFALALARIPSLKRSMVTGLWILLGSLLLGIGYFPPALEQSQVPRSYRFLIFHDASYDMLPKLKMVGRLASLGCRFSDLEIPDDRIRQTLEFLSYGDWPAPPPGGCRMRKPVLIEPASWSQ